MPYVSVGIWLGNTMDTFRSPGFGKRGCVAAALALALGVGATAAFATPHAPASGQLRPVTTCEDDGPGSLRAVIADPMTQSGDTVDLRGLQCGRITLSTGEIDIAQTELSLLGAGAGELVIDASGSSRVFDHPLGYLSITGMTLSGGFYHAVGDASGGCLRAADVYLADAAVRDCRVSSETGIASGGAIRADNLTLMRSHVSASQSDSASGMAYGGGAAVGTDVFAKYSTFSGNAVQPGAMVRGEGGALDAGGRITLDKCTVDHNVAPYTSGVRAWDRVDLHESTISGNLAQHGAAVFVHFSSARYFANIYNSSIAFNHSETEGDAAVIVEGTPPAGILTLYSSIIANNTSGAGHSPADLTVDALFSVPTIS
jgi:hypothetical protein